LSFVCHIVGDILGTKVVRTWEFNSTFPLRSIIPIYLTTGLPLLILKAVSSTSGYVISWYSLTVAVRLTITLLSLITDFTTMQLARWQDKVSAAVVMATSYISLVYYTRTFSNTLESFLFSALICVVAHRSQKEKSDIHYAFIISMLIVTGVFNRPTFVVYAMVPYLWWLFSDGVNRVIIKAINSVLIAIPLSIVLIICDSIYFSRLDINNLNSADLSDILSLVVNNLTVTPLNFVLYNTQFGNLAEHGIHPRFTHAVVNIPLLFSVLSVCFFYDVFRWCTMTVILRSWKLVLMHRRDVMLLACCLVPVILLSLFPHQEPRFLIPLLPVFAAMYARQITSRWSAALCWIVANVFGCLFYGCLHQAGVVPCLGHLQETQSTGVERHVTFWHTYTAPQHLLLQQLSSLTQDSTNTGTTVITSLEGNSVGDLIHHLRQINSSLSSQNREKLEVLVAATSSEHQYLVCMAAEAGIRLDLNRSFWPHLSTEHLPRMNDILCRIPRTNCHNITADDDSADFDNDDDDDDLCDKTIIERIHFLTSLNLYRVIFV